MNANPFRIGLLCALCILAAATARGELMYATTGFSIVQFDSATPNTVSQATNFSGLGKGESIIGFDVRPSNGLLYGISNTNRLYTINPLSGLASQVGNSGQFSLVGSNFGVDFNPVVDLLRVVSNDEQNMRIRPNDGTLVQNDTSLTPAGNVVAAAYSNNFVGAATTTLYGIDSTSGMLVLIGGLNGTPSPNGGVVTNIGSLGLGTFLSQFMGFDISGLTGIAYALIGVQPSGTEGNPGSRLFQIDLATGHATLVGAIGDGSISYLGITSAAAVPEPSTFVLLGTAAAAFVGYKRLRRAKR